MRIWNFRLSPHLFGEWWLVDPIFGLMRGRFSMPDIIGLHLMGLKVLPFPKIKADPKRREAFRVMHQIQAGLCSTKRLFVYTSA